MNPLLAPLWMAGLLWLLVAKQARQYRYLGFTFLSVFLVLLAMKAKSYYVAPAYPELFAAGAVAFERVTEAAALRWTRGAYAAAALIAGAAVAPFVVPVLTIRQFLAYQRTLSGFDPVQMENLAPSLLPQQYADEFGWQDMARATAKAYDALPQNDRSSTAVFADDYGEAAAIDYIGPTNRLPKAIGNDVTY